MLADPVGVTTFPDAVAGAATDGTVACGTVEDAVELTESPVVALRWFGIGFAGGKSSCETAIAISERNRARKKRLSIQGTGSYPPGRKG